MGLAGRYGTPLYVIDELSIRRRCREFREEFGSRYADTTVVFASKALAMPALVRILKEEGMGLDVVSGGEIYIAEAAGFPMDAVYFHGNNKSPEELKMALDKRVGRIVVDGLDELETLNRLAGENGHIPDILLRITPGVAAHTHSHITTGVEGSKFGFPMFMAGDAILKAMAADSLNLVGLHIHIGSLINETDPYLKSIDVVLDLAAEVKVRAGFELKELNVGGGYGEAYTLDDEVPPVSYYAEAITRRITDRCRALGLALPALVLEPGRSIVARAGVALYRAGFIKDVGSLRYVAVDGGMADNIRTALYEARYEAVLANRMNEPDTAPVTIAGRFCESGDILVRDVRLPEVKTGDVVAIPVCGAYCIPLSNNYNAVPRPAVVMVADGVDRVVRRRESHQDLIRNDVF